MIFFLWSFIFLSFLVNLEMGVCVWPFTSSNPLIMTESCWHLLCFTKVDSPSARPLGDESLLDSLLATVSTKDESSTYEFMVTNSENQHCKKLLSMWSRWAILLPCSSYSLIKFTYNNIIHSANFSSYAIF
jgi:hypothetical protein